MRVLAVTAHSDLPETHMFIGLKKAGVDLEVMCPDDAPHRQKMIDSGVEVHSLALKGRLDSDGASRIRQRLVSGQFHILHTFNNNAVSNGLRASKGLDVKFIAYRGIEANVSVFDPASWTTYLHPRVDKIICVADAIRRYLVNMRFLWWKFPSDKAITIYKGHELSWYQAPAVPRSEFGIPQDAFVVGCTANERPRKGLPYLIEAAKLMSPDANIHFLLIGNIDGTKTLQRIAESPAKDRIHLTGFRSDAPQVLANCDACILPAFKREGLPKAIIEGMVHSVTPIVTDSGGSPELIVHGKSGLIISPRSSQAIADAILQLYEDRAACKQMGVEARQRIQRDFHISKTIEQTLSLYREIFA
jgi:glycosyltransferase involved in cell wall biosynthesis